MDAEAKEKLIVYRSVPTDTREATPRPAMEARERLAQILAPSIGSEEEARLCADAILKTLHLSDAAALAHMNKEALSVPKVVTVEMITAARNAEVEFISRQRRRCADELGVGMVYIIDAAIAASPYKEPTNDPR